MPNMPVRRNRENRLARRENDHMKKILQPLFSLNMKARIYILVATAVIVSTAAASLFSFFRYKEDLSEKVSRTNRQLLEQVADNLDSYFDDLVRLSYAPAYNTALIEQLEQIRSGFEEAHQELETRRSIEKFLDEMMIYPRKDILHATLAAVPGFLSALRPTRKRSNGTSRRRRTLVALSMSGRTWTHSCKMKIRSSFRWSM